MPFDGFKVVIVDEQNRDLLASGAYTAKGHMEIYNLVDGKKVKYYTVKQQGGYPEPYLGFHLKKHDGERDYECLVIDGLEQGARVEHGAQPLINKRTAYVKYNNSEQDTIAYDVIRICDTRQHKGHTDHAHLTRILRLEINGVLCFDLSQRIYNKEFETYMPGCNGMGYVKHLRIKY